MCSGVTVRQRDDQGEFRVTVFFGSESEVGVHERRFWRVLRKQQKMGLYAYLGWIKGYIILTTRNPKLSYKNKGLSGQGRGAIAASPDRRNRPNPKISDGSGERPNACV